MDKGLQKHSDGGGKRSRGYKRSVPKHQFRLDVLLYFETHRMASTLAKSYADLSDVQLQTKPTSIYLWRKQMNKLVQMCKSLGTANLRKVRMVETGSTLPADTQVHLVKWVNCVMLSMSTCLMFDVTSCCVLPVMLVSLHAGASRGWVKGFLRRHRLALRAKTRQGQVTPENAGAVLKRFNVKVKQRMAELGVDVVYNADQTPVFFEYLPDTYITAKGAPTV
ncbi:LOW QUALITY PROTEIN: Protein Y6B3B.8 [Phytophthora palmivora]|uniref:Protein Y6B3B.8 n=1 Tax=Phytophthora palmivora TaxID=4796 RepID=A0A2P4YCR0_9STRA|nr:LOW QUALITY PROTEIN: Protein Y6B3B.8 [Phytophthora palmivora]